MNVVFWFFMVLMMLLAIALLILPLLKVRRQSSVAYKDSNLKLNEEKLKELDADLAEGRIDQAFYKTAREELDRELLIDIPAETTETAALHYSGVAKKHPATALLISVFVPTAALLLYLELGMHAASDEAFAAGQQHVPSSAVQQQASVEEMTQKLETRIAEQGGTSEDWTMLARARKYLGQNDLAVKAFNVAMESDPENAQLMLEAAEVIALNNGRVFTPEARTLVLKAYELEPENANVLWFIGVAEYQQGNYRQAIKHLKKLLPMAGGEEDVLKSIVSIVSKSRQQLIAAGEDMPSLEDLLGVPAMADVRQTSNQSSSTTGKPDASSSTSVTVKVDVSKEVREKYAAQDTVFVYAKAKSGPAMPLAVQRLTLAALPSTVILDDTMAMVEGMNLSAFDQLVISARLSKSGSAIAKSGDYIGQVNIDSKSTSDIDIIIDTPVP